MSQKCTDIQIFRDDAAKKSEKGRRAEILKFEDIPIFASMLSNKFLNIVAKFCQNSINVECENGNICLKNELLGEFMFAIAKNGRNALTC